MFGRKSENSLFYEEGRVEELIRENYEDIYRYNFYHTGNRVLAQDITQEVFLRFLNNLENYSEYGKVKNYLYVIAGNCIRDHQRRPRIFDMEMAAEESCDGGLEDIPERMSVADAVNSLADQEKEIIYLRYYQELKIRDIAAILSMPASTVRYQLKRAEKALRVKLEEKKSG